MKIKKFFLLLSMFPMISIGMEVPHHSDPFQAQSARMKDACKACKGEHQAYLRYKMLLDKKESGKKIKTCQVCCEYDGKCRNCDKTLETLARILEKNPPTPEKVATMLSACERMRSVKPSQILVTLRNCEQSRDFKLRHYLCTGEHLDPLTMPSQLMEAQNSVALNGVDLGDEGRLFVISQTDKNSIRFMAILAKEHEGFMLNAIRGNARLTKLYPAAFNPNDTYHFNFDIYHDTQASNLAFSIKSNTH